MNRVDIIIEDNDNELATGHLHRGHEIRLKKSSSVSEKCEFQSSLLNDRLKNFEIFRASIQTDDPAEDKMRTVGEYCDGSGFMMTSQVGRSIVREAEITKSYSDENLYITGILRNDDIISQTRDRRYRVGSTDPFSRPLCGIHCGSWFPSHKGKKELLTWVSSKYKSRICNINGAQINSFFSHQMVPPIY